MSNSKCKNGIVILEGVSSMKKIKINDLLRIPDTEVSNVRLKLNVDNGYTDPLEEYKRNPDKINVDWFLWHKERRYFHEGNIAICLLYLYDDRWLLTTIKRITKELDVNDDIGYEAEEIEEYCQYFGRLILSYHNVNRAMGRTYEALMEELEVLELLPVAYDGDEFPGYENIRLSYQQLATIIHRKREGWLDALKNQKAVYLITDRKTGKLYVGSATAQWGMLLQRWSSYIENGHGGNVELKELVQKEGFDYVKRNFQYSVLENYNARMDDKYVLQREVWWKETLCSRTHGYNSN